MQRAVTSTGAAVLSNSILRAEEGENETYEVSTSIQTRVTTGIMETWVKTNAQDKKGETKLPAASFSVSLPLTPEGTLPGSSVTCVIRGKVNLKTRLMTIREIVIFRDGVFPPNVHCFINLFEIIREKDKKNLLYYLPIGNNRNSGNAKRSRFVKEKSDQNPIANLQSKNLYRLEVYFSSDNKVKNVKNSFSGYLSTDDIEICLKKNELKFENDESRKDEGCFLTTAVCDLMGRPDSCFELNVLRSFRMNKLQHSNDGRKLLTEYDIAGPCLARFLYQSKYQLNSSLPLTIYWCYILPCVLLVKMGFNQLAIAHYKRLITFLQCKSLAVMGTIKY